MSVSLLLGLVYLISELLLTYSTSSRQAPTRRFPQPHRDEAGSEYVARRLARNHGECGGGDLCGETLACGGVAGLTQGIVSGLVLSAEGRKLRA
jgi:hypothetical protein